MEIVIQHKELLIHDILLYNVSPSLDLSGTVYELRNVVFRALMSQSWRWKMLIIKIRKDSIIFWLLRGLSSE